MQNKKKKRWVQLSFIRFKKTDGGGKYFRLYNDSDLGLNKFSEHLRIRKFDDDVESTDSQIEEAQKEIERDLRIPDEQYNLQTRSNLHLFPKGSFAEEWRIENDGSQ